MSNHRLWQSALHNLEHGPVRNEILDAHNQTIVGKEYHRLAVARREPLHIIVLKEDETPNIFMKQAGYEESSTYRNSARKRSGHGLENSTLQHGMNDLIPPSRPEI